MNRQILQEDIRAFAQRFPMYEALKGKRFLITGATGLIGSIMSKCLIELGRYRQLELTVYACVRDIEKARSLFSSWPELQLIPVSLENLNSVSSPKIDFLIHLASPTASDFFVSHPVETFQTIVNGTEEILRFAKKHRVGQVLFVSSMEVYGVLPSGVIATEDRMGYIDPSKPRSSYPLGKRAAEALCFNYWNEFALDVRIARLAQTFGAGISESENRVFAQFARSVLSNQDIILHTQGDSAHCYCYTTDAVSAMIYVLLAGEAGAVYNIGNKKTFCSIREMADCICDLVQTGSRVKIEIDPSAPYPPTSILRQDMTKIEQLGWRPEYNLTEMFGRLIKYL